MVKHQHEFRDPIHVFIRMDSDERRVVDSRPFQRLRHIHQLALTYLVYPGATHRRFEHSLGVMELAGRVFDVVTSQDNLTDPVRSTYPEVQEGSKLSYWRRVLRMAALCHDFGHLPFSHAAEEQLLPEKWTHEKLTREFVLSPEMQGLWSKMTPPFRPDDIVKLSLGKKEAPDLNFSDWETILSEIIVGNAFGVDRIDYLLRDAYHSGVAYGKFDHYRLIDTLRILPTSPTKEGTEGSRESSLGVEEGGIRSAEALALARYFMYSQVYFHPVRRIYDRHLQDFLGEWLPGGHFPTSVDKLIGLTDNEVTVAIREAANDQSIAGHRHAARIDRRQHFKVLYDRNPEDVTINRNAATCVAVAAAERFGEDNIRLDKYPPKVASEDFPVLTRDGRIASSLALSTVLNRIPVYPVGTVFVAPEIVKNAREWLNRERGAIIVPKEEPDGA